MREREPCFGNRIIMFARCEIAERLRVIFSREYRHSLGAMNVSFLPVRVAAWL